MYISYRMYFTSFYTSFTTPHSWCMFICSYIISSSSYLPPVFLHLLISWCLLSNFISQFSSLLILLRKNSDPKLSNQVSIYIKFSIKKNPNKQANNKKTKAKAYILCNESKRTNRQKKKLLIHCKVHLYTSSLLMKINGSLTTENGIVAYF